MYERHKYKEGSTSLEQIKDPVGTIKYDGGSYFVNIDPDGSPRVFSRRESVKGGYPEVTAKIPHITDTKVPEIAGNVYNVELIHTGHSKNNVESHPAVGGILNSLAPKALVTQKLTGPVRAVMFDVIHPELPTYKDKLDHLKYVERLFNKPDVIYTAPTKIGLQHISALIKDTADVGREGVIVTSLTTPEKENIRYKIKHFLTYNLKIVGITQEVDIKGNPKQGAGAFVLEDSTGRNVGNVGTGLTREVRIDAFNNPKNWLGKIIQVKAMPSTATKLRHPVYNGPADGELDEVK